MKYIKSKVKEEEPKKPEYAPGRTETRDKKKILIGIAKFYVGMLGVGFIIIFLSFLYHISHSAPF